MADTKVKLIALMPLHETRAVTKDEEFEVTEQRASLLVEAGMARMADTKDKGSSKTTAGSGKSPDLVWKKQISPADYLAKYPTGPQADLAKAILDKEAAEAAEAAAAATDETPAQE